MYVDARTGYHIYKVEYWDDELGIVYTENGPYNYNEVYTVKVPGYKEYDHIIVALEVNESDCEDKKYLR